MADTRPRILVTRPAAQAEAQAQLLRDLGAEAVVLPLIEIIGVEESAPGYGLLKSQIMDLDLYHKVIFISANAVRFGMDLIDQFWPQLPVGLDWFAIGQQTSAQLSEYGLTAIQSPTGYDSEALLNIPELQEVAGQKVLIMRGEGGRETLAETLRDRGARVDYADLYLRRLPDYTSEQISSTIGTDKLDGILITSGEALLNLDTLSAAENNLNTDTLIVVPSDRIARIAATLNYTRVITASGPDNRSMVDTVLSNIITDDQR